LALCVVLGGAIVTARADAAELVMFVDAGCPWCARWDREVGEAYAHSDEGRIAPLRRIDISAARRSGLRLASAVTVTPTFVLVERDVEVGRITGYPGPDFFWGMLGELIARLPAVTPRRFRETSLMPGRETTCARRVCGRSGLWVGKKTTRGDIGIPHPV
jgi:hypothetical protein